MSSRAREANEEPGAPRLKKDWKYFVGMTCLVLAMILPVFSFAVPSLGLSTELTATIIAFLAVGGPEVFLVLAALFLGKETIQYFKRRLLSWFRREPKPVGKVQYYVGLSMLVGSGVPHLLHAYLPDVLPGAIDSSTRLYVLATSDAIFVVSFFVLGDEFWGKLKLLFTWEGAVPAEARSRSTR